MAKSVKEAVLNVRLTMQPPLVQKMGDPACVNKDRLGADGGAISSTSGFASN